MYVVSKMESEQNNVVVKTVETDRCRVNLSYIGAFDYDEDINCDDEQDTSSSEVGSRPSIQSDILINDNHFASPEMPENRSRISVLENAIQDYTTQVKNCQSKDERAILTKKLVQLRYDLLNLKDLSTESKTNSVFLMGHTFEDKQLKAAKVYCEKCCYIIIGLFQAAYSCSECNYCCHTKCINNISRICPSQMIKDNPMPKLKICPEVGLHTQQYSCMECKSPIGFQPGTEEARQCDYSGSFYCNRCHWNDAVAIPARVLANWDFEPRKVCRASKAILRLTSKRAILNVREINQMLFTYISELAEVKKRREEILIMKSFFLECPYAMKEKLLLQLKHRQHFVESSDVYSFQDLIDVHQDVLLPEITKIHAAFSRHIKADCELCKGKGKTCKICLSEELLYPFDCTAHTCPTCSSTSHMHCYQIKNKKCPEGCS